MKKAYLLKRKILTVYRVDCVNLTKNNRKYGYARVSTPAQYLENQIAHLESHGVDRRDIFSDVVTGSKKPLGRQQFKLLLSKLEPGDTLVVYAIDRIGRRLTDILDVVDNLHARDIKVVVTTLNIDLTTPVGRMVLQQFCALAEFENEQMKARQRLGIERAKKEGKYKGRQSKINYLTIKTIERLYHQGYSTRKIASVVKLSKSTIHKFTTKWKQNNV